MIQKYKKKKDIGQNILIITFYNRDTCPVVVKQN